MPIAGALTVRDLHASDRRAFVEMFGRLSVESRRRRYLSAKASFTSREPVALTAVDQGHNSAVVAIDSADQITGVGRYAALGGDDSSAELAVEVVDDWQGRGIGTLLARRMIDRACANRLATPRSRRLGPSGRWFKSSRPDAQPD